MTNDSRLDFHTETDRDAEQRFLTKFVSQRDRAMELVALVRLAVRECLYSNDVIACARVSTVLLEYWFTEPLADHASVIPTAP